MHGASKQRPPRGSLRPCPAQVFPGQMEEKPTPLHCWLFLRTSPAAFIVLHLVSAGKTGHLCFQTVVTRIPPILPAVLAFFTKRQDLSPLALIPTSLELAYSQECSKSVTHGFQS